MAKFVSRVFKDLLHKYISKTLVDEGVKKNPIRMWLGVTL